MGGDTVGAMDEALRLRFLDLAKRMAPTAIKRLEREFVKRQTSKEDRGPQHLIEKAVHFAMETEHLDLAASLLI
jgi:hypothetical protein